MPVSPYSFNPPPGQEPGATKQNIFKESKTQLPTLANCDLTNPREMFAWMLVCTPGLPSSGAALITAVEWCYDMSERLYNCGARLHPEMMTIRYVPPMPNASIWYSASGRWEDIPAGQHPFVKNYLIEPEPEPEEEAEAEAEGVEDGDTP